MTAPFVRILHGDARERLRELDDESVHVCVTSPPYFWSRSYSDEGEQLLEGQLGLEETPGEYIAVLRGVFREVQRVLREDGTCWIVVGDSFFGDSNLRTASWSANGVQKTARRSAAKVEGFKPKDLLQVPSRLELGLAEDRWFVRSKVIWVKNQVKPENVFGWRWERHDIGDVDEPEKCPGCSKCLPNGGLVLRRGAWRPTVSYETVLQLSRSAMPYGDGEAVLEECASSPADIKKMIERKDRIGGKRITDPLNKVNITTRIGRKRAVGHPGGRNLRNVWVIPANARQRGHHAAFPERIPELCILASTPDVGCCSACAAPFARILGDPVEATGRGSGDRRRLVAGVDAPGRVNSHLGSSVPWTPTRRPTLGWKPTCGCGAETVPAVVLDPFLGSGTTLAVARRLGRSGIGIDLSREYIRLAKERVREVAGAEG